MHRWAALAALAAAFAATAASAQTDGRYGDPAHPNLAGVWQPDQSTNFVDYANTPLPLTPAYGRRLAETRRLSMAGTPPADTVSSCIAMGVVRFMLIGFEVTQAPGQLTLVNSILTDVRRIYTQGGHTPNADPTYNGNSAGRWEGETLVVETKDLRANTLDIFGTPHSDKLTVVERMRLTAPDKLEIQFALTDPEALTRQWVVTRTYTRRPAATRLEEYVCENNRNDRNGFQE